MVSHFLNNSTCTDLVIPLRSNTNPLVSLIPPNRLKFSTFTQLWYYNTPNGTEHPHGTHDVPHMYHDIPHMYHDIPHSTEHPPPYSRYLPKCIMISRHGTPHTLHRVMTVKFLR